jgi:hypothetical protein
MQPAKGVRKKTVVVHRVSLSVAAEARAWGGLFGTIPSSLFEAFNTVCRGDIRRGSMPIGMAAKLLESIVLRPGPAPLRPPRSWAGGGSGTLS